MENYIKEILQSIVELINAYRSGSKETLPLYSLKLKKQYELVEKSNLTKDFYNNLSNEFSDDAELYVLLLSVIYSVTLDKECILQVMNILNQDKLDIFQSLFLRMQMEREIFCNSEIKNTYRIRRVINEHLVNKIEKEMQLDFKKIPVRDRDRKKVIIVTNQLLGNLHAPSRIVKEICASLQKDLGYEVLLIVAVEQFDNSLKEGLWINPFTFNYDIAYNDNFLIEYNQVQIKGFQVIIKNNNFEFIKSLMNEIYELKPYFAWYIGGATFYADLMRKFTTVVSMPCTDGYAISEAQIMLNYINSGGEEVKEAEAYLKEKGQDILHMNLAFSYKKSDKTYTREQFNIPKDAFAVTVVGNRLDLEVSSEFIDVLYHVLRIDSKICLVFIGEYNTFYNNFKEANEEGRAVYLGYQEDLVDVLSIMDLFINPKRKGAGGGASRALSVGVPVITTDYCDAAYTVGKDFICSDYDQMLELVDRYCHDKEFYNNQSALAKSRKSEQYDLAKNLQLVMKDIDKLINKKAVVILSGYNMRAIIAFMRVCKEKEIPFYIIASGEQDSIFHTEYKEHVVYIRNDNDISDLVSIVLNIKDKYNLEELFMLPSTEYLNRYLVLNKNEFRKHNIGIPLVDKELYSTISDKSSFYQLCKKYNLMVPACYETIENAVFPCILKPKTYDTYMGKPILLENKEIYNQLAIDNKKDWTIEQYIIGESWYLLYYFKKDGSYSCFSQKNLIQQGGGGSICLAVSSDLHKKDICKVYADMFINEGFQGLVMVEVKKSNEKYFMIEANPRLWGPSQLFVDANISFFEEYLIDMGFDIQIDNKKLSKQNVYYFWESGLSNTKDNTYYGYDDIQLKEMLKELSNYEVYNRKDTKKLYEEGL
ncbi:hypothetical protein GCM10023142_12890 [Anaerocolumna aminovalerica]|jgi:glycosyltransferase involved in cell wall biosynthesis/predicted ATP-grasp superfamily ATP-dependent carboligase|uniref:Glycosyltransferase involved in cell wall bisynthesis n=1 Tax=Anaerocolumna aminovalerica TaxID=1527 RepID=A0A1I5DLN9_9FIRM|nr:glycosyltransferase [Anaerocolumna aminovalerica]MBU5332230.1 glycosyltransferase [Anaerocolumna aminovalerica]MDU6263934.1 glycosyltransferase [Anaerocolumna aminovalerica]SFO00169.1 Glycosyltransferase involved in cell wall bisynthesis [Anaerocolumna aminovalerica]